MALHLGQRQAARDAFEAAAALFEDQRRTLSGDEFRHALLSDHLQPYRALLAMALDPEEGLEADPATVLLQLERVRARSLGERLTGAVPSEANPDLPVPRGRLNWLYRRLRRVQEEGGESQPLLDELHTTERQLLEALRRERLVAGAADATKGGDDGVELDSLCQALGEQEALVEYGVSGTELFACVVRTDGVRLIRRLAFLARRAAGRGVPAVPDRHAAAWQRPGGAPPATPSAARSTTPAAIARHALGPAGRQPDRLFARPHRAAWPAREPALCRPARWTSAVGRRAADGPCAERARGPAWIAASRPSTGCSLGPGAGGGRVKPSATGRVRAWHVASLFPTSVCLVDEMATLDAMRAAAPDADLIHLACPVPQRQPPSSALHLRDGAVTAEWLQGLKLQPAMVVLSACETGLAEQGQGDEMVGLVRAFLLAGAARVVAALWPVDDLVTAQFMSAFYGEWVGGAPVPAHCNAPRPR